MFSVFFENLSGGSPTHWCYIRAASPQRTWSDPYSPHCISTSLTSGSFRWVIKACRAVLCEFVSLHQMEQVIERSIVFYWYIYFWWQSKLFFFLWFDFSGRQSYWCGSKHAVMRGWMEEWAVCINQKVGSKGKVPLPTRTSQLLIMWKRAENQKVPAK